MVKGFGFYVVGLKVLQGRIIRIDQLFRNATSLNNSPPFFSFWSIYKQVSLVPKLHEQRVVRESEKQFSLETCRTTLHSGGKTRSCLDHCKCKSCQPKKSADKHLYPFILQTFLSSVSEENHKLFIY